MTWGLAVGMASILITLIVGFGSTMRTLGRMEQKFELVWAWYIRETSAERAGGRRHSDPPARWQAHDDGMQRDD